jgi:thymidine kinase
VLEFPPELEAAATCAAPGAPPQQQQQQQPRAPASSMSGRRLALRFDMPVGLDWLCGLPDHNAALGEGRLEVILGPMFAGKTTALLDRVKQLAGTGGGGKGGGGGRVHVAVKSSKDSRYSTHWVVAHNGHCMRCYTADSLAQFRLALGPLWHKVSVLAVDEAQFFPDLVEFCGQAVDGDGKTVIVAGLSGARLRRRARGRPGRGGSAVACVGPACSSSRRCSACATHATPKRRAARTPCPPAHAAAGDFRRQRFGQVLDLLPLADKVTQLTSKCGFCDAE